jgi:hypothetical protein
MLNKPQVKNRAKVPKEAVRVQAKAENHQVVEAEENPLEAAAKAENHQAVEKALVKAEKVKEKVLEAERVKAKAKAKVTVRVNPLMMEHQVKMLEMISKMRLMLRLKQ